MPAGRSRLGYEFTDDDHLVVRNPLNALRVLSGSWSTDARNRLLYRAESSSGGALVPDAVALDGAWRVAKGDELAFAVRTRDREAHQVIHFKGAFVRANASTLVFAVRRDDRGTRSSDELTLSGRWHLDDRNKLTFLVEKSHGPQDTLALEGGWEIGKHHELIYRSNQSFSLDGAWDLPASNRLLYRLVGAPHSAIEFRGALEKPVIDAKAGKMVFQLGASGRRSRTGRERITLFGTWKVGRDRAVRFEILYAGRRRQAIEFEGAVKLTKRDRLAVALRSARGEPLGITLVFTRQWLKNASLFVQLKRSADETAAFGGVQVRF